MRWERALPHISGKFAEFLPYLHCSLKSVQRSQPAVPGKRITFNNQHVFQSKLMLLAAMSPAPRLQLQLPTAAQSSSQAALAGRIFKGRATTSWNSEQEQTSATAMMDCHSPLAGTGPLSPCARLQGCGEVKLKSAEQPQYTPRTPAFPFLLLGSFRFAACTGSITLMLSQTSSHSRKVLWVYVSMQSISDSFSFLQK